MSYKVKLALIHLFHGVNYRKLPVSQQLARDTRSDSLTTGKLSLIQIVQNIIEKIYQLRRSWQIIAGGDWSGVS